MVNTGKVFQLDIGSSSDINALLYLLAANQKTQHVDPTRSTSPPAKLPNNGYNYAILVNVNVKQNFVEIDSIRFSKDHVMTNYPEIIFLNR